VSERPELSLSSRDYRLLEELTGHTRLLVEGQSREPYYICARCKRPWPCDAGLVVAFIYRIYRNVRIAPEETEERPHVS